MATRDGRGRSKRPIPTTVLRTASILAAIAEPVVIASATPSNAPAPSTPAVLSPGRAFIEADGASLYANICQGCHMRDGRGTTGAATYPSLVSNPDLRSAAYTAEVVLKGLRAMPAVGRSMSDYQVAAVVTYVRDRFGHFADDPASATDVKTLRARKNE